MMPPRTEPDTSGDVRDIIDREPVGALQIMVMVLCGVVMLVDGFDTQSISYVLPRLALEWQLPRDALGPIISAALFGSVIGDCAIVLLSPRVGHKRMLMIDMVVFALALMATIWVTSLTQLLVCRFVAGMALGAVVPSVIALACEYLPERRRASAILLIYACYSIGFVCAGIAAAAVLPAYGWRSLFVIGSIAPLPLLAVIAAVMPESLLRLSRAENASARLAGILARLFPDRRVPADVVFLADGAARSGLSSRSRADTLAGTMLLWVMVFINTGLFYFLQSWLPTMLTNLHYQQNQLVLITALTTIGGALSVFIIGPAFDRFGPYRTLALLFAGAGISVALIGASFSWSAAAMMATTFAAGVFVSGGQKGLIALAATFYSLAHSATGIGWVLGLGRIGGSVAALLIGLLYAAQWPLAQIFLVAALPLFAALACVLAMAQRQAGANRIVMRADSQVVLK